MVNSRLVTFAEMCRCGCCWKAGETAWPSRTQPWSSAISLERAHVDELVTVGEKPERVLAHQERPLADCAGTRDACLRDSHATAIDSPLPKNPQLWRNPGKVSDLQSEHLTRRSLPHALASESKSDTRDTDSHHDGVRLKSDTRDTDRARRSPPRAPSSSRRRSSGRRGPAPGRSAAGASELRGPPVIDVSDCEYVSSSAISHLGLDRLHAPGGLHAVEAPAPGVEVAVDRADRLVGHVTSNSSTAMGSSSTGSSVFA